MTDQGSDALLLEELSRLTNEYAVLYRGAVQEAATDRADLEEVRRTLATVAHDLRSPLTVVTGATRLLDGTELSDAQRDLVARIRRAAELMTDLAQDLVDAIGMRRAQLTVAPVDVTDVAETVASRHRLVAAGSARITFAGPDVSGEPLLVLGDKPKLERMVDNLVANALKFSPDEAPVVVRVSQDDAHARIEVTDRGPGIEPEHHEAIFTAFHRTPGAAGTPGTGLGLAIVREIAELHRGRVTVRSAPGQGAAFTVELPRLAARTGGTAATDV